MVAEAAADVARLVDSVVPCNPRETPSGNEQGGDNPQERGLARAVCAENGQGLAFANFKRQTCERHSRRLFERLEKGAPSAAGGRKRLGQRFDLDGSFRHQKPYSVSAA